MGEITVWVDRKDNPQMSDAELAKANAKWADLNSINQDKINEQWNREQGSKPYGSSSRY